MKCNWEEQIWKKRVRYYTKDILYVHSENKCFRKDLIRKYYRYVLAYNEACNILLRIFVGSDYIINTQ